MLTRIVLLFVIIISFGCEDNNLSKQCSAGETEVDELIDEIKASLNNCGCDISIIQGTYKGQTVFFTSITDPACNSIDTPTLYDCSGNVVRIFTASESDQKELTEKVSRDQVLYTCSD
jgi:hypothetical protein